MELVDEREELGVPAENYVFDFWCARGIDIAMRG